MTVPYFFGYGSLVNRNTHSYAQSHKAQLHGWRRVWRHTTWQPRPLLTVERDPECTIDGLIAHVPNDDWNALDHREAAYDRVSVTGVVTHAGPSLIDIATYHVPVEKLPKPACDLPIVLSYVDVVVQGYLREFGEDAAAGFFRTTAGWGAPILDDRHNPHYPRHQSLTRAEQNFVDAQLRVLAT